MRQLSLEVRLSEREIARLETVQPWISSNYDPNRYVLWADTWEMAAELVDEDAIAYKPDGSVLFRLVKACVSYDLLDLAWENLRWSGTPVSNSSRGRSVGRGDALHQDQSATEKIAGYFDRQGGRFPYCRKTGWTREHWQHFQLASPYVQRINEVFREHMPVRYAAQEQFALTTPDYVIPNTAFSTMTVNLNVRTTPHTDKGDLQEGFGVLSVTALTPKCFEGGELIFPRYGVAVLPRNGDVLLCDVHEVHCNGTFRYEGRELLQGFERLACVFYYRKRISDCLPPAAERLRAQQQMSASW
jgi:hypothetical protein